jgi:choline dehydrogenase
MCNLPPPHMVCLILYNLSHAGETVVVCLCSYKFSMKKASGLMYDYVIVGAGSAGCVLAHRLTEDPSVSVLLLEAGGPDTQQEIHIPVAFSKLFKTPVDWTYYTEEQEHLDGRKLYWPRGKVLGGSSSLNAMIYHRGSRHDYDSWAEAGNQGWGYSDLLPYFKKAEHQERGPSNYHGTGGPLNVSDLRTVHPLASAFVDACAEVGVPRTNDFNGSDEMGAGVFQVTQKRGQRWSTARAYLQRARTRPNLTVRTQVHVTRLLWEKMRVVGISYIHDGKEVQERINREVLLCGGAINSPQTLLLSGVGPAEALKQLDIPVVIDLPGVGQHLEDHLSTGVLTFCKQPISLAGAESMVNLLNYMLFRRGPLTSNVAEAGAFIKTSDDLPAHDLEILLAPAFFMAHGAENPPGHGFTLGVILLRPQSHGFIALRSNDPLAPPIIQPNYLANEADMQVLVDGIKMARRIVQAHAFDAFRGDEFAPGEAAQSDEAIAEQVRAHAETLYHPTGTCKMGNDAMAVVDDQLRVRGVEGLRVVDASIMPSIIGGHTNAPTIAIAEKAADLIKGKAPQPVSQDQSAQALP